MKYFLRYRIFTICNGLLISQLIKLTFPTPYVSGAIYTSNIRSLTLKPCEFSLNAMFQYKICLTILFPLIDTFFDYNLILVSVIDICNTQKKRS